MNAYAQTIARKSIAMGMKSKLSAALVLNGKQSKIFFLKPPSASCNFQRMAKRTMSTLPTTPARYETNEHDEQVAFWKHKFESAMARKKSGIHKESANLASEARKNGVLSAHWKREIASYLERKSMNALLSASLDQSPVSENQRSYTSSFARSNTRNCRASNNVLSPFWRNQIASYLLRKSANASLVASITTRAMATYTGPSLSTIPLTMALDENSQSSTDEKDDIWCIAWIGNSSLRVTAFAYNDQYKPVVLLRQRQRQHSMCCRKL